MDTDELQLLGMRVSLLDAEPNRILDPLPELVQRVSLSVAATEAQHGSHVPAIAVPLYNEVEFPSHAPSLQGRDYRSS